MAEFIKSPKRKIVILLGYCGHNYHGMQLNPNVPTIEQELFQALEKIGSVAPQNSLLTSNRIDYQRAARTDKGVHAVGQVISFKSHTQLLPSDSSTNEEISNEKEENFLSQIKERLNQILPKDIRVWGCVRSTNAFNAKNACNARLYEYMLPTYCLSEFEQNDLKGFHQMSAEIEERLMKVYGEGQSNHEYKFTKQEEDNEEAVADQEEEEVEEFKEMKQKRNERIFDRNSFRISQEQMSKLRELLNIFKGTHNFHNFTVGRPFWDKSAQRFIMDFSVSEPFLVNGMEWVRFHILGQSFVLHQIRKMIGYCILSLKTKAPATLLPKIFGKVRVNVPKAPALGLFLHHPLFEIYNQMVERKAAKEPNFQGQKIEFDDFKDEMETFKHENIYPQIYKTELEECTFGNWVECCKDFSFSYTYLQPDGEIPEIFTKLAKLGNYHPEKKDNIEKRKQRSKIEWKKKKVRKDVPIQ